MIIYGSMEMQKARAKEQQAQQFFLQVNVVDFIFLYI
jgi:hypothetical protein